MRLVTIVVYFVTIIIVGFFGWLYIRDVDKKKKKLRLLSNICVLI